MQILKVDKKYFNDNLEFFRKNLGYVYNYDTAQGLQELKIDFNDKNFEEVRENVFKEVYIGHKKFFDDNSKNFLIIACEDGKIYSIASFEIIDNNYYIDGVSTRCEQRHKGLATQVLKFGLTKLDRKALLHVDKNNTAAQMLYKKLGFMPEKNIKLNFAQNNLLLSK